MTPSPPANDNNHDQAMPPQSSSSPSSSSPLHSNNNNNDPSSPSPSSPSIPLPILPSTPPPTTKSPLTSSQSLLRSFLASRAGTASPTPGHGHAHAHAHARTQSHQLPQRTETMRVLAPSPSPSPVQVQTQQQPAARTPLAGIETNNQLLKEKRGGAHGHGHKHGHKHGWSVGDINIAPYNSSASPGANETESERRGRRKEEDDDDVGLPASPSPSKRGRSKSVISLGFFREKSPEKEEKKNKKNRDKSRGRRYTIRSSRRETQDNATGGNAATPESSPTKQRYILRRSANSMSPEKQQQQAQKSPKKTKSGTNLSSLFRISTSRLKSSADLTSIATDIPSPSSPTRKPTKPHENHASASPSTSSSFSNQPLTDIPPTSPLWSSIFNKPLTHPPAPIDPSADPNTESSLADYELQARTKHSKSKSRPTSPTKQHSDGDGGGSGSGGRGRARRKSIILGKGVMDLFRGSGGGKPAEQQQEVQQQQQQQAQQEYAGVADNMGPPPSPTKKKGSNVAALISVFNQREKAEKAVPTAPNTSAQQQQQQHQAQGQTQGQHTSQPNSHSSRRSTKQQKQPHQQQHWTQHDLDTAFEDMLESRNIPHNMRDKMRGLDVNIKTDFIQKHQHADDLLARSSAAAMGASTTTLALAGPGSGSGVNSGVGAGPGSEKSTHSRRSGRQKDKDKQHSTTRGGGNGEEAISDTNEQQKSRRSRLRSRTFSKDSMKRARSQSKCKRPKSTDGGRPASVRSFGSNKSGITAASLNSTTPGVDGAGYITGTHIIAPEQPDDTFDPADFVHYLREVQKPELVKVAKLHKLRLLLRNETVSWVDQFVWEGGMDEVIELIYRILGVEWREEHEDALLHETLLCLKALSTTARGLAHLEDVQDRLFPTLLHMLFDDERKGPAEFTTRGIVIGLLFNHLSAPAPEERAGRSDKVLGFLRDPSAPKEEQPPTFIQNMRTVRPYKVWCREVTNTAREVFWIFLHHANVIPLPEPEPEPAPSAQKRRTTGYAYGESEDESQTEFYDEDEEAAAAAAQEEPERSNPNLTHPDHNHNHDHTAPSDDTPYAIKFYPPPRTPVPAAPYVGGVEWDATNYIATHLDLMNALIATQPTLDKRNALRHELRVSGFEKVMGQYLRTCKEKFYASVHDALRLWVGAAGEDGWDVEDVRRGFRREQGREREEVRVGNVGVASVVRVPGVQGKGKKGEEAPRVDVETPTPRLSLDLDLGMGM